MPTVAVSSKPDYKTINFDTMPFIVIWEMTRSCALKCIHCRAEAINERNPHELTTEQAFSLLDEIKRFQSDSSKPGPLVVLTGGDPMRRPDAYSIVEYGARLGLRMTMTPSGTQEMTPDIVRELKSRGLARLAVSLDGSNERIHDAFRRVEGSFRWTMDIIRWANEVRLPVQINTTITRHNIQDVDELCSVMESLKIVLWSVFFLVPTGRGKLEDEVLAVDYERVFHKMYNLSLKSSFDIKATEAPHYRRVVLQRHQKKERSFKNHTGPGFFVPAAAQNGGDGIGRAARGVNAGNGFVFISHTGDINPSGFLPVSAGNIKKDSLVDVYRTSELFTSIRDYSKLKGKCGVCEYRSMCGGSRSRAYAVFGDIMESDPFCVYVPKGYPITEEEKKFWK